MLTPSSASALTFRRLHGYLPHDRRPFKSLTLSSRSATLRTAFSAISWASAETVLSFNHRLGTGAVRLSRAEVPSPTGYPLGSTTIPRSFPMHRTRIPRVCVYFLLFSFFHWRTFLFGLPPVIYWHVLPSFHIVPGCLGAIVQAWRPAHWASWMFEVDGYDAEKQLLAWTRGGFQGARGDDVGAEFYIENVFEELDAPAEW